MQQNASAVYLYFLRVLCYNGGIINGERTKYEHKRQIFFHSRGQHFDVSKRVARHGGRQHQLDDPSQRSVLRRGQVGRDAKRYLVAAGDRPLGDDAFGQQLVERLLRAQNMARNGRRLYRPMRTAACGRRGASGNRPRLDRGVFGYQRLQLFRRSARDARDRL